VAAFQPLPSLGQGGCSCRSGFEDQKQGGRDTPKFDGIKLTNYTGAAFIHCARIDFMASIHIQVITFRSWVPAKLNSDLLATVHPTQGRLLYSTLLLHTTERSGKALAAGHPVLIFVGFSFQERTNEKRKLFIM
jgi:hypothetical protein